MILRILGFAVAILDENRKIHFVRKSMLRRLGERYVFPPLNKKILLSQIIRRPPNGIQWNLLEADKCGISAGERQRIEKAVNPLLGEKFAGHKLKKNGDLLPLSVFAIQDRLFLSLSQKRAGIAGKGGQRIIKFAYDLKRGRKVVRKKMTPLERDAVRCFQGIRGIAKTEAVFTENILFEKYYAGSLKQLIEAKRALDSSVILQISKDLLQTLSEIHKRKTEDGRPAFHSDIKLDNLFYRPSKKRGLEVVIGDFGYANSDKSICGTCSWFSPEYAKEFLGRHLEKKFDHELNRKFGQALDLWGIGLVMASLLIQDGKGRLSCLRFSGNRYNVMQKILKVDQQVIDHEIAIRQYHEKDAHLKELWTIVGKLLRVNPCERMPAENALKGLLQKL